MQPVGISWLLLIALVVIALLAHLRGQPRRALLFDVVIIAFLAVFIVVIRHDLATIERFDGDSNLWLPAIAAFVATILGMACQYFFFSIDSRGNLKPFKRWLFLRPFLVSPIVFLPVILTWDRAAITSQSLPSVVLLMLLSFQNGFFWRAVFDRAQTNVAPTT